MNSNKLLIVEDEALIRLNLKIYFEGKGYHIDEAETGETGLSLLEQGSYSLCIIDDGLPDTSAQKFVIQAHKVSPNTKHLIYTGTSNYQLPSVLKNYGLTQNSVLYKVKDGLSDISDRISAILENK